MHHALALMRDVGVCPEAVGVVITCNKGCVEAGLLKGDFLLGWGGGSAVVSRGGREWIVNVGETDFEAEALPKGRGVSNHRGGGSPCAGGRGGGRVAAIEEGEGGTERGVALLGEACICPKPDPCLCSLGFRVEGLGEACICPKPNCFLCSLSFMSQTLRTIYPHLNPKP